MILRGVVQDCVVDLVVSEDRLILFEAQAAQPTADIGPRHFRRASAVCYTLYKQYKSAGAAKLTTTRG